MYHFYNKSIYYWDSPGSPVVKTPPCQCRGEGLISGWGPSKIQQVARRLKKKERKKEKVAITKY